MKPHALGVISLAATIALAPCLGEDAKHVEQRTYTPEPQLTTAEIVITTSSGRPTLLLSGKWVMPRK